MNIAVSRAFGNHEQIQKMDKCVRIKMDKGEMRMIETIAISAYLLFSFSGWLATVKFFTLGDWDEDWRVRGAYRKEPGFDLSWCEVFWFAVVALVPVVNVGMNSFWFWVLYQQYRDRHEGRHLFELSEVKLPKCNLPQCPVAIKARRTNQ